ncbi:cell division protein PomZ [Rhodoferax lithotrophicus]|uniref:Cell division protein PomZ n=1 Tax=Rhodoferax lithotrophicus TaxID=2798804 RepID=A0ABM7MH36_9BURK|nr:cellulose biosynthesis protein BcsQ [Rhodoferax sp. MIZ03]BCO25528.1 cell division protein PomZ [Rhodoferax sp. MIZ03]
MHVIAFISGKGGVGKTTMAANIAVALSQRQKRVLLIDLDPQNAQRFHLGMNPDEIAGLAREGIKPTSIFDSPFGVSFIPFGRVSELELEEFESQHVVLDTPPGPSVYLRQALEAANRAMVVLLADAASFATIDKISSLIDQYTSDRSDFAGMNLLINQMPINSKLGHQVRSALYANYADKLVPASIHRDARVSQALAFERPVLQYEPGCKASLDIQYVAEWLLSSTEA